MTNEEELILENQARIFQLLSTMVEDRELAELAMTSSRITLEYIKRWKTGKNNG